MVVYAKCIEIKIVCIFYQTKIETNQSPTLKIFAILVHLPLIWKRTEKTGSIDMFQDIFEQIRIRLNLWFLYFQYRYVIKNLKLNLDNNWIKHRNGLLNKKNWKNDKSILSSNRFKKSITFDMLCYCILYLINITWPSQIYIV